jgi:hypothetical protein
MSPPVTAPSIVHVMSEPDCVFVKARPTEMAGSMKPRISMSKPSMLKPITDPANAFQPYEETLSVERAISVVAGRALLATGSTNLSRFYSLAECLK